MVCLSECAGDICDEAWTGPETDNSADEMSHVL